MTFGSLPQRGSRGGGGVTAQSSAPENGEKGNGACRERIAPGTPRKDLAALQQPVHIFLGGRQGLLDAHLIEERRLEIRRDRRDDLPREAEANAAVHQLDVLLELAQDGVITVQ